MSRTTAPPPAAPWAVRADGFACLPGEERRVMRELELLPPGATRPYVGSAAFREPTGPQGETLPTRDRASCCMFYPVRPEGGCATRPRTRDADPFAKLPAAAAN